MLKPAVKTGAENLPRHIAIIMDGNGRWAKARGLPRTAGHKKGAETTQDIVKFCSELGVEYLTLYAFSSENWRRPVTEVSELMNLLSLYISRELKTLIEGGVRLKVIGERDKLPKAVLAKLEDAEKKTENNQGLVLQMALSYGSRQEIVRAAQMIAEDAKSGKLEPESLDEDGFNRYLYTHGAPDPDLLIRTGGEHRISNFLLWQAAYTELYFTGCMWPDFSRDDLLEAIKDFSGRERRYGTA